MSRGQGASFKQERLKGYFVSSSWCFLPAVVKMGSFTQVGVNTRKPLTPYLVMSDFTKGILVLHSLSKNTRITYTHKTPPRGTLPGEMMQVSRSTS